ncbi:MAG TPA: hypothetical protein PKA41_17350 [Verrucomicrobiota bacterium]|nr:hypothetical protein [Verrucomicrobiota bacterium]
MKSSAQIIHGGGWLTRQAIRRPRARFFGFLSLLWMAVSICASSPFWGGWPQAFGWLEWLCSVLILLQPLFVVLAVVFLLTEQPRVIVERHPNPDCDIRKLY